MLAAASPGPRPAPELDVCIVVEGCYPFVAGGVSSWLDWLLRSQPERRFGVVAIAADDRPRPLKFQLPPNVASFQVVPLDGALRRPTGPQPRIDAARLADLLHDVTRRGSLAALLDLADLANRPVLRAGLLPWGRPRPPSVSDLLCSEAGWQATLACYERIAPQAAFLDFFWAWRSLVGGLLAMATAPMPAARVYHAISTGYAGLAAVLAARRAGATCAITEHGIYANERRIDLIMADWITDTVRAGLGGGDDRIDVRSFWIDSFESYARAAYAGADRITTLYGANQFFQRHMGAPEEKLRVIPNGIQLERFARIPREPQPRPTVALIGRIVPIKDIATCIAAAALVRRRVPDVHVLLLGPTEEDEDYHALCRRQVAELGLEETVTFAGQVDITQHLGRIDVLLLTSISEAQPLVLLEAGAAGVPCVATDVGSCREIIEGAPDEEPRLGPAGAVAPPMDPEAIAAALCDLLLDPDLRARCGEALRTRVGRYFTSEMSARRYADLYDELGG